MWLSVSIHDLESYQQESANLNNLVLREAETITSKIFNCAKSYVAKSLSHIIHLILVDKNKNFAESLAALTNQEIKAAYNLFSKLDKTLSCEQCSLRQKVIIRDFIITHLSTTLNNIDDSIRYSSRA